MEQAVESLQVGVDKQNNRMVILIRASPQGQGSSSSNNILKGFKI